MMVQRFNVSVPSSKIEHLRQRLQLSTFPDELDEAAWDYGAPLKDVKRLAAYWQNSFDWRKAEAKINEMPNYRAKLQVDDFGELMVHYVHQKSPVKNAIPLLFCHGWPGSFIEVSKLLPLLKGNNDGKTPAFHIVAPSLPNFGFSDGIKKRGFGLKQYAETCHKLMQGLGYDDYVTQGGDWGYFITRMMGALYPQHVKASHINMMRGNPPTYSSNPFLALQHSISPYTDFEKRALERAKWFQTEGAGYRQEQSTRPQTLGYALADSPVGLLAWLWEKLHDWTDAYPWTDDEILTWVSIYWFSAAGPAASLRIYYEVAHSPPELGRDRTSQWIGGVKLGQAHYPKELGGIPKTWARTMGPVVWESEHPEGGHFAAWEKPRNMAEDLWGMFGKKGPCAGIIKGRSGYA